jgi:biopolymer transport protein TolR
MDMGLGQIRSTIAAPVSALFVLLALAAFEERQHTSVGVPLHVYPIPPDPPKTWGCNSRELVVVLDEKGKVWINETETPLDQLRPHLAEIFENRYLKRVFVVADSSVSYEQFVDFISRIEGASPGLEVMLFSGDLRRAQEQRAVVPCVFLPGMFRLFGKHGSGI